MLSRSTPVGFNPGAPRRDPRSPRSFSPSTVSPWCFGINRLSYFAGARQSRASQAPAMDAGCKYLYHGGAVEAGIAYIRSSRAVSGLMGVIAVYSIFGFQYLTNDAVLRGCAAHGASGYGLL